MFTVLSNTRNANVYLIAALAVVAVALLTFAVLPAISAAKPVSIPITGNSDVTSDYFLRHPEFNISAPAVDTNSDFYRRHPEWKSNVENIIPVNGNSELSDYFLRHPQLSVPAGIAVDTADYILRHPEMRPSADLSDYFLRH